MANRAQKKRRQAQRKAAAAAKPEPEAQGSVAAPRPAESPAEPPKIIALLSWYDEDPSWLVASLASLSKLGVDHVVALDGAYILLPEGKNVSPPEQHSAIVEICLGMGVGLTLHVPDNVWVGNEVEKRSFLFQLGEQIARPNKDFYFVVDADEVMKDCPGDVKKRLAESKFDAARVTLLNRKPPSTGQEHEFAWDPNSKVALPKFFRAIPGLRVVGNHYTYALPDGRKLWGQGDGMTSGLVEDYLNLEDLTIDHRTATRDKYRRKLQCDYYDRRERMNIEHSTCSRCDEPPTRLFPTNFSRDPENGDLLGWSVWVCEHHADEVADESLKQLHGLGIDPRAIDWQAVGPAR